MKKAHAFGRMHGSIKVARCGARSAAGMGRIGRRHSEPYIVYREEDVTCDRCLATAPRSFRGRSAAWFSRSQRDVRARCPVGTRLQTLLLSRIHFPTAKRAREWAKSHGFKTSKVDPTKNYFRLRQADPKRFSKLRTIHLRPGVMAVVGCPR